LVLMHRWFDAKKREKGRAIDRTKKKETRVHLGQKRETVKKLPITNGGFQIPGPMVFTSISDEMKGFEKKVAIFC